MDVERAKSPSSPEIYNQNVIREAVPFLQF